MKFKQYFKLFSLVLVFIFIATSVSGCSLFGGDEETEDNTIVIWGFDDEDVWKPVFKDLEDKLKGINVEYEKKTLNGKYENDALNSILSGTGPDVWAIPSDWINRHKDKLTPMPKELLENSGSEIIVDEQFAPIISETSVYGEDIYSLSPTIDSLVVYYNPSIFEKTLEEELVSGRIPGPGGETSSDDNLSTSNNHDLLTQPPTNWSDFIKTSQLLTKKSGSTITQAGVAMGTSSNVVYSQDIVYSLMLQIGQKMVSEDLNTAVFNLSENSKTILGQNVLDFYRSFSDATDDNYSWNTEFENSVDAFANGKVAMIIGYGSLSGSLSQKYPTFSYQTSPFPQITDSVSDKKVYGKYTSFVVPRLSDQPVQAWEIINYLSTYYSNVYSSAMMLPPSYSKASGPGGENEDFTQLFGGYQTNNPNIVTTWHKGRYPVEIDHTFREAITEMINSDRSSSEIIDSASDKTTSLLRKESW